MKEADLSKPWGGFDVEVGPPVRDLNAQILPYPPVHHINRNVLAALIEAVQEEKVIGFAVFLCHLATSMTLNVPCCGGIPIPSSFRDEAIRWFNADMPEGGTLLLACSEHVKFLTNQVSFRLTWSRMPEEFWQDVSVPYQEVSQCP